MTELFVGAMWAAMAARIVLVAYWRVHATKLVPVMRKLQRAILPAVLVPLFLSMGLAIAPPVAARSLPGTAQGGSSELRIERVEGMVHDGISLDEAVSRAERQYRARVVRTDVQDEDGRKVYVLKLLSEDGRVITVRIDAATGRMR
jgi:hypothetical protein